MGYSVGNFWHKNLVLGEFRCRHRHAKIPKFIDISTYCRHFADMSPTFPAKMRRCCAPVGMVVCVARGPRWGRTRDSAAARLLWWGALTLMGVIDLITLGAGSITGVLLIVISWLSLDMVFRTCFAVRVRVSMKGGALVRQGTVRMGELSITLCSATHASCWQSLVTLCSKEIGVGCKRPSMQVPRSLSNHLPLGVLLDLAVCYVSSFINTHKFWCGVMEGSCVRIFLRGYLFVWLQYLVSKEEFLNLNSPRGFRRSLGQRPHFIHFIDFFGFLWHFNQWSKLPKKPLPTSFNLFTMLIYKAQPSIVSVYQTQRL